MKRFRKKRKSAAFPLPVLLVLPLALVVFLFTSRLSSAEQMTVVGLAAGGLLAVVGILSGVGWWRWRLQRQRQKSLRLSEVDQMPGITFEHYVAALLRHQGYQNVTVTPDLNDFGADVLFEQDGITFAAQVKRYRGYVGVEALYQAIGGRDYYHRQRAVVITNSHFSTQAHILAKKANVWLVDRQMLADWIHQFSQ